MIFTTTTEPPAMSLKKQKMQGSNSVNFTEILLKQHCTVFKWLTLHCKISNSKTYSSFFYEFNILVERLNIIKEIMNRSKQ